MNPRVLVGFSAGIIFFGSLSLAFGIHQSDVGICTRKFPWDNIADNLYTWTMSCSIAGIFGDNPDDSRSALYAVSGGTIASHTSHGSKLKVYNNLFNFTNITLTQGCFGGHVRVSSVAIKSPGHEYDYAHCGSLDSAMQVFVNNTGGKGDNVIDSGSNVYIVWNSTMTTSEVPHVVWGYSTPFDEPSDDISGQESFGPSIQQASVNYQPADSCTMKGQNIDWPGGNSSGFNQRDQAAKVLGGAERMMLPNGVWRYDFECSGFLNPASSINKGDIKKTVFVNVGGIPRPAIRSFSVSPSVIEVGNGATLSFGVTTGQAVINGNPVGVDGNGNGSKALKPANDSNIGELTLSFDSNSEPIPTAHTFTLKARNIQYSPDGKNSVPPFYESAPQTVTVTVNPPPRPVVRDFKVEPVTFQVDRDPHFTASWNVENMGSVRWMKINNGVELPRTSTGSIDFPISKVGGMLPFGERSVKLTVQPRFGNAITATVKVVINPSPLPIVKSFTIEPANYEKGDLRVQRLYMKWEIENATSMHALRLVLRDGSRVDLPLEATGAYTITAPPKERGVYTYLLQPVRKYDLEVVDEPALVTVDLPPPPKITAMTITPELIQSGESAVITWTSTDASSASMSPDVGKGVVQTNGSMTIFPKYTTQYTLTVRGSIAEVGEDRSFRTIRVTSDTPQEPKIIIPDLPEPEIIIPDLPTLPQVQSDFEFGGSVPRFVAPQLKTLPSFAPQDIPSLQAVDSGKGKATQKLDLKVNGQDDFITLSSPAVFTLSWNIDTYCLAHGSWVGAKRKAGTEDIRKINSGTYTFKMYCPGVGSDEVKVKVVGGPNELGSGTGSGADADAFPTAEASISIDGEHFEKSVRVRQGEKVPVWIGAAFDVNNDGKASSDATGKWTALMSFGGRCEVNSRLARNVQQIFDMAVFDPVNVEECMVSIGEITFDKPGIHQYEVLRLVQNDGKISKSAFVNVVVDEPLPPEGPPVINLRVNGKESPATVTALTLYTISWTTRDADSCTASGMWDGEKTMNGSQTFYASTKRTFSYTLTCKGGLGTTRETLSVKVAELPQCTFGALPLVLDQESVFERESKLSWKCKFANSCEISPNTGAIVDTFGSVRVAPINTTKYTLTCSNLDGSTDFDVTVRVE